MGTPFLRATDTYPRHLPEDFAPELAGLPVPYHLIPQVMASRPEDFIRAARAFLDAGAEFVDLNCGCPSPNPVSGGAGSSLLKTRDTFVRFIEAVAEGLPPASFSVKMRTGFDDAETFAELVEGLRPLPLRQLTVHGRTRKDRYDGEARWDLIRAAQELLPYPVVASGDIVSAARWAEKRARYPELTRAIIGRGALRNPWIFTELEGDRTVTLEPSTLLLSLACFARILDDSFERPERLLGMARDGLFAGCRGTSEGAWRELWQALDGRPLQELAVERFALGRLKMLWNSLRSSLPEPFFEPTLLRSKSAGAFLESVQKLGERPLELRHNPQLDWLYTSSKTKSVEAGF